MKTLFERFLITENQEMFLELAGHSYKLKGFCTDPYGKDYEEEYLAIVSVNTKPGEKPWRMTVYSDLNHPRGISSVVHLQLDSEYSYLELGTNNDWSDSIIDDIKQYINEDCNFVETEPITQEQLEVMISLKHQS